MSDETVESVINAVLYEGYFLYPYRPSSLKNKQRWNFGVLYPPEFEDVLAGFETSFIQTQCILRTSGGGRVQVKALFLQQGGEQVFERKAFTDPLAASDGVNETFCFSFSPVEGEITFRSERLAEGALRLTVTLRNRTVFQGRDRDEALKHSLIAASMLLNAEGADFVSLIDPPEEMAAWTAQCKNIKTWPVLVGEQSRTDTLFSAPIILYDYPKIAPQSPINFFDTTEIDEMLAYRILTLTDQEKSEMQKSDPRVSELLARVNGLSEKDLANLHGKSDIRAIPVLKPGDQVRLKPRPGRDIYDIALKGKIATVESLERDYENRLYVTVTVNDDPGRDLGREGKAGHRFFFDLDEVEVL